MPLPFAGPDRLLAHFQRHGDARSLGRLFDRTAPELLRVACWLCGNRADAEDLLQRTFLTVLTTRGRYDASRRALPWLCGVLGNHAKKLREQRARPALVALPGAERDPAGAAADAELAAAVARLRERIGAPYAEVLDLHLEEGLDAKTIAARLGRPAGTVRTQLVRALQRLRDLLPGGFVAGAGTLLAANAHAASLATVRAAVLRAAGSETAVAGAGGALLASGGLLMAKKLLPVAALGLLLAGAGVWLATRTAVVRDAGVPAATALAGAIPPPGAPRGVEAAAATAAVVSPAPTREPAPAAAHPLAEAGFATVELRVRWADDGSPAANVGAIATPQPRGRFLEREGLTDAHGVLVLRGLRPGPCWLDTAFTETERLELVAGAVHTVDVAATRVGTVDGVVVDERQQPVADARLWLSVRNSPFRGFEVARSDAGGRFRLSVADGQALGARKTGHAPSRLVRLRRANPGLVLTLPAAGGTVRGQVVDADGRPVAGAQVEVGLAGGWAVPTSTAAELVAFPTAPRLTTDPGGTFVCEGVAAGDTEVRAWAAGFGPASVQVLVTAGRDVDALVVLPRAATVEGTVRRADGRAVAAATVTRTGAYFEFGRPTTETDEAGRYRLGDLPPGGVSLTATTPDGSLTQTIATAAGATTTWDPVVAAAPARALTGRVVPPAGAALPPLRVGVLAPSSPSPHPLVKANERGEFVLVGLDARDVTLVVRADDESMTTFAIREHVPVGAAPYTLTLTAAELPSARIRGRVVDADGAPLAAVLTLRLPSWSTAPFTQCSPDGRFDRGALPAGVYHGSVEAKGYGRTVLVPVPLAIGETKELPDIVLARAGRTELELRGDDAAARFGSVVIVRTDGTAVCWVQPDGPRVSAELPPGSYVALADHGADAARATFTVRSGETTRASLAFAPAANATIRWRHAGAPPTGILRILVRDAAGQLAAAAELHLDVPGLRRTTSLQRRLQPGSYQVELLAGDGRSASALLLVPDVASTPSVVVELPAR